MTLYFINIDGRFTAHEEIATCYFDTDFFMGMSSYNSRRNGGCLEIVACMQKN